MIDHEDKVFEIISEALGLEFQGIEILNEKVLPTQTTFPALSIVQIDNSIAEEYSTFDKQENVVSEIYEFDAVSNLVDQRASQAKKILEAVDSLMTLLGYTRIFFGPEVDKEENFARRVARYKKLIIN